MPHQRLLTKLGAYGIGGHLITWIKKYLTGRVQRVSVNGKMSTICNVSSGIPQGSVLGPVLFNLFINDLPSVVKNSTMKLFADDTKLYRVVDSQEDANLLQEDLDQMVKWSRTWQLPFNDRKCKVMHYGKKNHKFTYTMESTEGRKEMSTDNGQGEKDLGVLFDSDLSFSSHAADVAKRANTKLGMIKRSFTSLGTIIIKGMLQLYKTIVRPTLEYCISAWRPKFLKDDDMLEKVQQRATKLIPEVKHLSYSERLKSLKLPTLEYRRQRADQIQVFKVMNELEDLKREFLFEMNTESRTRGHKYKVRKPKCKSKTRQLSFSLRCVNDWNNLPSSAVNASSVNQFGKTSLKCPPPPPPTKKKIDLLYF